MRNKIENFEDYAVHLIEQARIESGLSIEKLAKLIKIEPSLYEKFIFEDCNCISPDEFFSIVMVTDPTGKLSDELSKASDLVLDGTFDPV